MNHETCFSRRTVSLAIVSILTIMGSLALAVPTVISYQGRLTNSSGQPITTAVDVTFTFWDAETGGNQFVGFTDTDSVTPSSNGTFTTTIGDDPGNPIPAAIFASDSVWLNISVGGTNLAPRTRMISAPYAMKARNSDFSTTAAHALNADNAENANRAILANAALNAGNADTVDNKHAADFASAIHGHQLQNLGGAVTDAQVPDNLTIHSGTIDNTPIGSTLATTANFTHVVTNGNVVLGDEVTDQITVNGALKIASGSPGLDKVLTSDSAGNATWKFARTCYQNIIVVAKSGGDYATITAALNSISNASDANRFLIYVAPGVYSEKITMKEYVDIEGSGELTTKIVYTGNVSSAYATLIGASNAELRFLTVENTGGNNYAVAIRNNSSAPRLNHITVVASGGTTANYGILNESAPPIINNMIILVSGNATTCYGIYNHLSSPDISDITVNVSGVNINYGIRSEISSPVAIRNSIFSISSGGATNWGIRNDSPATLDNIVVSVQGSGTSTNYAIYNSDVATLIKVTASASGGDKSYAIYNTSATVTIMNSSAEASGATTINDGVHCTFESSAVIDQSVISAHGDTGKAISNHYDSSVTLNHVTANATGTDYNYGVYNNTSDITIQNSSISGIGGLCYGLFNVAASGAYTANIDNSKITGATFTIFNDTEFTVRIGASQLNGGGIVNPATCKCAGVYDENYNFFPNTCP